MIIKSLIIIILLFIFEGCTDKKNLYTPKKDEKLTVAKAQNNIKKGMSSAEVIKIMGSPNIISTDKESNEVWVYDKISTQNTSRDSSAGVGFLPAFLLTSTKNNTSSQKTLTIIIKFNNNKQVKDISYHTSRF